MESQPPIARIDPHLAQWIMFILSLVFFGIAILGAVGEYLGWWDLIGEVAVTVGTVGGLLLGFASFLTSSTESQVATVHGAVRDNGSALQQVHSAVRDNGEKLDKLDKLDRIEAALVAQDGQTSKLDVVQAELDRQTGVLDRQVAILTEIRDRM